MNKQLPLNLTSTPFLVSHGNVHEPPKYGYDHYHQGLELLFIHEGAGTIFTGGRLYEMASGQLYFFQPYQYHKVNMDAGKPYSRTVIKFEPTALLPFFQPFEAISKFLNDLWKGAAAVQCMTLSDQEQHSIKAFVNLQEHQGRISEQSAFESFAAHMISLMETLRLTQSSRLFFTSEYQQTTLRYSELIMTWIEDHLQEPFNLNKLAQAIHLSKNHISRRFKAETGCSIQEYLAARRIRKACQLLHTTCFSVEHIAVEVGLGNPSYFCKLFKRYVGHSPLQYKRKFASN